MEDKRTENVWRHKKQAYERTTIIYIRSWKAIRIETDVSDHITTEVLSQEEHSVKFILYKINKAEQKLYNHGKGNANGDTDNEEMAQISGRK